MTRSTLAVKSRKKDNGPAKGQCVMESGRDLDVFSLSLSVRHSDFLVAGGPAKFIAVAHRRRCALAALAGRITMLDCPLKRSLTARALLSFVPRRAPRPRLTYLTRLGSVFLSSHPPRSVPMPTTPPSAVSSKDFSSRSQRLRSANHQSCFY